MVTSDIQQTFLKATLVPIYRTTWDLPPETHVELASGISFENAEKVLKPENFELWNQYVSEDARKKLGSVRFALVHRFTSTAHVGVEEQKSIDLMYRVFVCLRLIKPTKITWSNIQFKDTSEGIDVFSFTHPNEIPAATPESEAFNEITLSDIARLRGLLPTFLGIVDQGPLNVRRAIQHYELGYSEIHNAALQFVTWMMALEQFYAVGDAPLPRGELIRRISDYVNIDEDIYADTQFREIFPNVPAITVRQTLRDLFVLRSRFVHGLWIQEKWLEPARERTLYEKTSHADVLREVASWLVRNSLIRYLENAAHK